MKRKGTCVSKEPHDLAAEQALIGAMLLQPQIIPRVQQSVRSRDFYAEAHRHIVTALYETKQPDYVTVMDTLARMGIAEQCENALTAILDAVATAAGWSYYVEIVRDKADRRNFIRLCLEAAERIRKPEEELDTITSALRHDLVAMTTSHTRTYRALKALLDEALERYKNPRQGILTGFRNIDKHMQGLERKTTTYLAARPSIGKTALALNIAKHIAQSACGVVLFFSLESHAGAVADRLVAEQSGIPLSSLKVAVADDRWQDVKEAEAQLKDIGLLIADNPKFKTVEYLCAAAEGFSIEKRIALIVVDHIQRMRTLRKLQNRHYELSWVSEELSTLAKIVDAPLLILSQLRRPTAGSAGEQRPTLYDLKESGDIEANADNVWGLFRESREAQYATLEQLKGRDTGTWLEVLSFNGSRQRFSDARKSLLCEADPNLQTKQKKSGPPAI